MRDALAVAMETEVQLEAMETPEGKTFRDIARKDGLKAALAWRDARFGGGKGAANGPRSERNSRAIQPFLYGRRIASAPARAAARDCGPLTRDQDKRGAQEQEEVRHVGTNHQGSALLGPLALSGCIFRHPL